MTLCCAFSVFSSIFTTYVGKVPEKQAFQVERHAIFPTTSFALQCMSIFFSLFLEKDYLVRTIRKNFADDGLLQWSTEGRNIRPKPKFFTIRPSALATEILF